MSHTYTITCCTTALDIDSQRQSRCPECGRVFVTRDHKESGYRLGEPSAVPPGHLHLIPLQCVVTGHLVTCCSSPFPMDSAERSEGLPLPFIALISAVGRVSS